jgi:hypothetical protein
MPLLTKLIIQEANLPTFASSGTRYINCPLLSSIATFTFWHSHDDHTIRQILHPSFFSDLAQFAYSYYKARSVLLAEKRSQASFHRTLTPKYPQTASVMATAKVAAATARV